MYGRVKEEKIHHPYVDRSTVGIKELAFVASEGSVVNECDLFNFQ